ncbi:MAG: site-specific integrase [Bacteroidales bacterium]|jgi:integrase|nr:site-specific integrase [Bacteroidales bacterium]
MNKTPLVEFVYNRHKTASATKEAAVELRVTFERKQKYMTTGVRLLPKQWHRGTVTNRVDAIQLNQTLEKLMIDVRQVVVNMMTEGSIDIFSIPDRLKRLRSGNINFLDFCDKRMKIRQYGKAEDSQERYTRFMKFFRGWGKIAEFEDITDLNIIALDEHLAARGLKPYSKWNNYHRFLNSFILDAIDEGYIKRNPYKWVRIEKEKSKGGIGKYLSPQEFTKVRDMELPTESLQRVRDLFVFQTYTCLSYVDLSTFDAEKIEKVKGMKVYIGTRAKTSQTFTIPLLKPALAILKKYNNHLPIISNVKYNEYLKVVAQNASIDKPVSSHWARHTGATLLLNSGDVPMNIVQHILGHASQRMTEQVYAKRLDESIVDAMAKIDGKI